MSKLHTLSTKELTAFDEKIRMAMLGEKPEVQRNLRLIREQVVDEMKYRVQLSNG